MTKDELLSKFSGLNVWSRGDSRAPHKPLLVLYALAKLQKGQGWLLFENLDKPFSELLRNYSHYSKSVHPEYPFWRLKNDGIWELKNAENVQARKGNTDAKKSELVKFNVTGGFLLEIQEKLIKNPDLIPIVAINLLKAHFPDTWHEDILEAIGLEAQGQNGSSSRDQNFRPRILKAYQYSCAICGHSMHFGDRWPTLEAAHIRWFQANGPDIESNGLALCCNHHKLFDRGGITLDESNILIVSEDLNGSNLQDQILAFHGKPIRKPIRSDYAPSTKYTEWHRREVFRGIAREI